MSRPVPPSPEDTERDAWLAQALRHAPDADMAPPPSLSEMILREAQAKAKPAATPPARPPQPLWMRAWVWMAKPSVGAGLASVMVATLVGVMLWDRPLEERSPRSTMNLPTAPAAAPAPAAEPVPPAPAQKPAPAEPAHDLAAPAADALKQQSAAKMKEELATAEKKRQVVPSERRAEVAKAVVAAKDDRQRADTAGQAPDALGKAARTAQAMAPAAPAMDAAPAPTVATVAPPAQAPAPPAPEALRSRVAGGQAARAPDEPSLTALRASLAAESAQWRWQRDAGAAHAIDDALAAFLAEVDAAAGNRWQPSRLAGLAASTSNAVAAQAKTETFRDKAVAPALRLVRDGRTLHVLRLDGHVLRWERHDVEGSQVTREASITLDDAQLDAVRRALDKLAP